MRDVKHDCPFMQQLIELISVKRPDIKFGTVLRSGKVSALKATRLETQDRVRGALSMMKREYGPRILRNANLFVSADQLSRYVFGSWHPQVPAEEPFKFHEFLKELRDEQAIWRAEFDLTDHPRNSIYWLEASRNLEKAGKLLELLFLASSAVGENKLTSSFTSSKKMAEYLMVAYELDDTNSAYIWSDFINLLRRHGVIYG